MAEQTLRVLAGLIGTRDDAEHDEEPGKVHPRAARRRGRAAGALPARPLLRHGRRDAAVPLPAVRRTPTGAATCRCSASSSRRSRRCSAGSTAGRPRRRRVARVPAARAHGPAQPGLEGLRRGRPGPVRGAAGAAGHAGGAPGVRVAREAPPRAAVRTRRGRGAADALLREAGELREAARALLAARPRLLLHGLGRRRPAEPGARVQPGPPPLGARGAPGARAPSATR